MKVKILSLTVAAFALTLTARGADSSKKPGFIEGPTKARLEKVAEVEVPEGFRFLDGKGTRALLKAAGEPTSGDELGLLMPTGTNKQWSIIFEFNEIGYVKDTDKDDLTKNADKLLASIKRGTAQANKERERNGNPPLEIVGWETPPRYDPTTHNLEWCIRATSGGQAILNYNTRLLGRKGVMEVVLVVDPEDLEATLPEFRKLLTGYTFDTGQTYAEYRSGDKVAKYGLAALVLGGAAVGAAKLGLFAWIAVIFKKAWKLVIIAFAAIAGVIKKLIEKVTGGRRSPHAGE